MKSDIPSGAGTILPETCEMAREAARRSGLSIYEWLNCAIIDKAAGDDVRPVDGVGNEPDKEPDPEEIILVATDSPVDGMTDQPTPRTLHPHNAAVTQEPPVQRGEDTIDLDHISSVLHQAIEALQSAETRVRELTEVLQGLVDLADISRPRHLADVQRLLTQARKLLSAPAQTAPPYDPPEAVVSVPVLAA